MTKTNKTMIQRLKAAAAAGVTISSIARAAELSPFRLQAIINEYPGRSPKFSADEWQRIEKALDDIKAAI